MDLTIFYGIERISIISNSIEGIFSTPKASTCLRLVNGDV
jgi:hypothetical protein